jgi:hypothetical protein
MAEGKSFDMAKEFANLDFNSVRFLPVFLQNSSCHPWLKQIRRHIVPLFSPRLSSHYRRFPPTPPLPPQYCALIVKL